MSERKLILPTEVKVCATCTYWDGVRKVDPDVNVVVVNESCCGECLVSEQSMPALAVAQIDRGCLWEDMNPDEPAQLDGNDVSLEADDPASAPVVAKTAQKTKTTV